MSNGLEPRAGKGAEFSTLVALLRYRSQSQPEQVAYTFLENGETESSCLTYGELRQQVQVIAAYLQSFGMTGERALLLYPPGLEFITAFLGCLSASVVAVPAYPPRRNHNLSRLQAIIEDAQAKVVLTTASLRGSIKRQLAQEPALSNLVCLATDNLTNDLATAWQETAVSGDSLALLQYTSGSTGKPKGVMVSHGNLLCNSVDIDRGWEHTSDSKILTWLPTFHDMGLIYGVIQPLYKGIPCYMMPPVSFLQRPMRWLQAISHYGITHSGAPNFAYERCIHHITPDQRALLDLRTWRMALNGAEPVRAKVLQRFAEVFQPCGFEIAAFCPGYGLAEATLKVTAVRKQDPPKFYLVQREALEQNRVVAVRETGQGLQTLIGCGYSEIDTQIVIVHPELLTACPAGEIGEIWVSGSTVAQGYWMRPTETEQTFRAYLAKSGKGPFLRTGDLGFIREKELFVTGRLKDLIVIRGRNYYPQDIEVTVQNSHDALRVGCGAAFSVEMDHQEQLVIVQEVERAHLRKLKAAEVIEAIRSAISHEYELSVHEILLLKTASIAKTSSGKIQRRACRAQYLAKTLNIVGRWRATHQLSVNGSSRGSSENGLTKSLGPQAESSQTRADQLIEWLRAYANRRINSRLIDERRCIPPHIVLDFGKQRLLGMQVPQQYGGLGLNYRNTLRVFEQLGGIDLTLAAFVGVHHALGTRPLLRFAQTAMRDQWLPLVAQGRDLAAFAITEPGAGSNPKAIAATAVPNGQGSWQLRGQKVWIGSGSWANVLNVFVQQLDRDCQPMGITGFVVPQEAAGLVQGPEALTMGMRGMVQNSVHLQDVVVNPEQILGEPGAGIQVAQDAMMFGRLGLGAISVGGMKRCAQLMLRYAQRRSIGTGSLLDNPVTLIRLNELTAGYLVVETLITKLATLLDRGETIPEEAYIACKTSGPEFLWQGTDHLMQLLGGRGYIETNFAPQLLRDARLLRIFEGPTETLHMFLGSRVLNKGDELQQFLCQTLGAPEIAQQLQSVASDIHQRCLAGTFAVRSAAERWAYSLTGELATLAILWATAQESYEDSKSEALGRAVDWVRSRFEQKRQTVLSGLSAESLSIDAKSITQLISESVAAIGDLEQTLLGEDHELDELLRKNQPDIHIDLKSHVAFECPAKAEAPIGQGTDATPSRDIESSQRAITIQHWLEEWLASRLRLDAKSLDPDKSFADYGMDSVMAVDLAFDLESWLDHQQDLEATIVWNFPNIGSLARYLAGQSATPAEREVEFVAKPELDVTLPSDAADPVSHLSATEVKDSIAQEVAELEKLIGSH